MSTLPNRLLITVVALTILVPSVLLSQVKIKEKVEIQPKPPAHAARIGGIYDFYSPPLFITDAFVLSLKSAVTITGTVDVSDQIGYFQSADVSYVVYDYFDPSVFYGTAVAWKGREPAPWGGNWYEGQSPCTVTLQAGKTPDVELLLGRAGFDGFGKRQFTGSESALDFSFTGMRTKRDGSPAPVTGTGHVIGSALASARFNGWKIEARPPFLGCGESTSLSITPLDGSGAQYCPVASELMSGSFTVSVQAKGNYAYLQYGDQEGNSVTISVPQQYGQYECDLVLDTRRGDIPGDRDTAIVTVTGGGSSKSIPVELMCEKFDHLAIISSSQNVLEGSSVKLTVIAEDIYDQEVTLPTDFDVTLTIYSYGDFAGSFSVDGGAPARETVTVPYSLARAGRIRYLANDALSEGEDCTGVEIDVCRTSDEDKWGYVDEIIARSVCASVTFTPSTLAPGDTATLTLAAGSGDTMFDVSILGDDGKSGTLVSLSGSGAALQGVLGPFQYIAPTTIDGSSKTIQVAAFSYGSCGGGTPMSVDVPIIEKKVSGYAAAQLLRKRVPLSKIHGLSLIKQGRLKSTAQSLSKQEQQTVMLSIAKRLAEITCPPGEVVVRRAGLDHFVVTPTPDTITHGENAKLTVLAVDAQGKEVSIDDNTPITFAASPADYGTFLLEGVIPYSQAKAGIMRYSSKDQKIAGSGFQQIQVTATGAGKSGNARLTIKNTPCDDAESCATAGAPPPPPSFSVVPRPNGYNGSYLSECNDDRTAQGGFRPIYEGNSVSTEPFTVDVCFDSESKVWRFGVSNPIQVNCLLDICESNIPFGVTRVFDVSDVNAFDKCWQGLSDLKGHRKYPVRYSKYVFIQVLLMHEQMHMLDFKTKLFAKMPYLVRLFQEIQNFPCGHFADVETAKKEGYNLVKEAVDAFLSSGNNNWVKWVESLRANGTFEQQTQNSLPVQRLIDDLITQLNCSN